MSVVVHIIEKIINKEDKKKGVLLSSGSEGVCSPAKIRSGAKSVQSGLTPPKKHIEKTKSYAELESRNQKTLPW